MDKYKNAIIAVLAGLLALTLSTPNAQSATSTTAKAIEYAQCLDMQAKGARSIDWLQDAIKTCAFYRP